MSRPPDRDLADAVKLHQAGQLKDAIRLYETVVRKAPRHSAALNLLGVAYSQAGDVAKAVELVQRALALDPNIPGGHFNLGMMLQHLNRADEAVAAYRRAVAAKPDDVQAVAHLASNLELAGQDAEAIAHFRRALSLDPERADIWHSLANLLYRDKQYEAARSAGERALQLRPGVAATHYHLGNALTELHRIKEATGHFEIAARLMPDHPDIHYNLGTALVALEQYEAALASYDRAFALDKNHSQALWNKGVLLLSLGRFPEGWAHYAKRGSIGPTKIEWQDYQAPEWNGEAVNGTVLLWGEQGLGDQILFASMLDDAVPLVKELVVAVEPRLVTLFERSFPAATIVAGDLSQRYAGQVEAQLAFGDLGRFFRKDATMFPGRPYLKADPQTSAALRARLSPDGRPVVGLSWRSANPIHGRSKSARLSDLMPVFAHRDWRFIDLQYGDTQEERAQLERDSGVRIERLPDIDNTLDIEGLAALIAACDAVVSVSNTTAHLACALGTPTWLMAQFGSTRPWCWGRHDDKTPWYPAARVVRQQADQPWSELAIVVADELGRRLPRV